MNYPFIYKAEVIFRKVYHDFLYGKRENVSFVDLPKNFIETKDPTYTEQLYDSVRRSVIKTAAPCIWGSFLLFKRF